MSSKRKSIRGNGKAPKKARATRYVFEGLHRDPGAADEGVQRGDDVCDADSEIMAIDGRQGDRRCREVEAWGQTFHCCSVCGPSRVWRAAGNLPKCLPPKDLGVGACCNIDVPPETHDRSYQTDRAYVDGGNVRNVFVSAAGKGVFPADRWQRYAIDEDGDCFYNAMTKAINSTVVRPELRRGISAQGAELENMTVHKLRWASAMHVRPGAAFAARRQFYQIEAPDDLKEEYMMVRRASELQQMMLHPDHWATMIDVRDIYENIDLDVIPVIINATFGQKTMDGQAIHPSMNPLTVFYGASKERLQREVQRHAQGMSTIRFVLLLYGGRVGPHFELIVKTDKKARDRGGPEFYDALFKFDEVPAQVANSFGIQLV